MVFGQLFRFRLQCSGLNANTTKQKKEASYGRSFSPSLSKRIHHQTISVYIGLQFPTARLRCSRQILLIHTARLAAWLCIPSKNLPAAFNRSIRDFGLARSQDRRP